MSKKGFAPLFIIIILGLAVLGGIGVYFVKNQTSNVLTRFLGVKPVETPSVSESIPLQDNEISSGTHQEIPSQHLDTKSSLGKFVGVTSKTYTGNLGGVEGANAKCNIEFSGSHFCDDQELENLNLDEINTTDLKKMGLRKDLGYVGMFCWINGFESCVNPSTKLSWNFDSKDTQSLNYQSIYGRLKYSLPRSEESENGNYTSKYSIFTVISDHDVECYLPSPLCCCK